MLVQLYNLPLEYSYPMVIIRIAKALGTPLNMDSNTASGLFDTFAMVLVKTDMMFGLQESVVIITGNNSFSVEFKYENVPPLYTCHQIGHLAANCQRFGTEEAQNKGKEVT